MPFGNSSSSSSTPSIRVYSSNHNQSQNHTGPSAVSSSNRQQQRTADQHPHAHHSYRRPSASQQQHPHLIPSPSSSSFPPTTTSSAAAVPMPIPNAHAAAPPPLPPPRHISGLSSGHDPGWAWSNNGQRVAETGRTVKPGSSLLGGGFQHTPSRSEDERDYHQQYDARMGSSRRSSHSQNEREMMIDPEIGQQESYEGSDDDRSGRGKRPSLADWRLRSENHLGHQAMQNSTTAYDKSLLSRIGGPKSPSRQQGPSLPSSATSEPGQSPQSSFGGRGAKFQGQLKPLSVPEQQQQQQRYPSLDSPHSRWSQSAVSPRGGFRSPLFEHGADNASSFSSSRHNSTANIADHDLPMSGGLGIGSGRRSGRNSVDQSVFLDPELAEDHGMRSLDLNDDHDRSPSAGEDGHSNKGTKRRASSPPSDGPREDRAPGSGSDLYHRRSQQHQHQQALAHRTHAQHAIGSSARLNPVHGSLSSINSSVGARNSYASSWNAASMASSVTSHGGERLSPHALSPSGHYDTSFGGDRGYHQQQQSYPQPQHGHGFSRGQQQQQGAKQGQGEGAAGHGPLSPRYGSSRTQAQTQPANTPPPHHFHHNTRQHNHSHSHSQHPQHNHHSHSHGQQQFSQPGLPSEGAPTSIHTSPVAPSPPSSHHQQQRRPSSAGTASATTNTSAKMQGPYVCECCPKKPKKFESQKDLDAHMNEKQFQCAHCTNRFKNKNEAERHQNSIHLRKHSWSCSALPGVHAAFHPSPAHPTTSDICGYCGDEFANPADWDVRAEHLTQIHKFDECNQAKKFFRADHFRQHLKHSHAGTSGKWTNMLETACMKDEAPPVPRDLGAVAKAAAAASAASAAAAQARAQAEAQAAAQAGLAAGGVSSGPYYNLHPQLKHQPSSPGGSVASGGGDRGGGGASLSNIMNDPLEE